MRHLATDHPIDSSLQRKVHAGIIALAAVCTLVCATVAAAQDRVYPSTGSTGMTGDNPAREARAGRSEARRERDEDAARLERNRFARCDVLSGQDREYCIRRMSGEGKVDGTVQGGGISRELTVTVPAPSAR